MRYNFCTLFDMNFASRGLALYRSLERHCKDSFLLTILCIDEETHDTLAKLDLAHARLWMVEDIGDAELLALRATRPRREFCWTCPGPLMLSLLRELADGEIVSYLDADLAFFSDPAPIYEEMGTKDILIHAHRYAPKYEAWAETSGIFNVGLVAIRKSPEGLSCLERWRKQCLENCSLAPGYCGDQKYLDEWPSLYRNLGILEHPGAALAPWNVDNHAIDSLGGRVTVDSKPLIFFHYHALNILVSGVFGFCGVVPPPSYPIGRKERRLLYQPYARLLRRATREIARITTPAAQVRQTTSLGELYAYSRRRQLVIG